MYWHLLESPNCACLTQVAASPAFCGSGVRFFIHYEFLQDSYSSSLVTMTQWDSDKYSVWINLGFHDTCLAFVSCIMDKGRKATQFLKQAYIQFCTQTAALTFRTTREDISGQSQKCLVVHWHAEQECQKMSIRGSLWLAAYFFII